LPLTTQVLSADLKPKSFLVNSVESGLRFMRMRRLHGLAAVAAHKLGGLMPVSAIFKTSFMIGQARSERTPQASPVEKALRVLP